MGRKIIAYILVLVLAATVMPVHFTWAEETDPEVIETDVPETIEEEENVPAEELSFVDGSIRIGVGESVQLALKGADGAAVRYASSDKSAAVSAEGVVKGVRKGMAVITAQSEDGRTAECRIEVCAAPKKVSLSAKKLTLGVGQSVKIEYSLPEGSTGSVRFSSDRQEIASVNERTGEISACAEGKAKICARTYNGKKAFVEIKVVAAPQAMRVTPEEVTLGVGQTVKLSAQADNGVAGGFAWSSADDAVAKCENGVVAGVSAGSTEIKVSAYNGIAAHCRVTVVDAPQQVEISHEELTIGVGETVQILASAGDGVQVDFASSKPKNASVTADGVVKGVRKGTAEITASAYNGQAAVCRVNVLAAPSKVTLKSKTMTMGVGENALLAYKLPAGAAGAVTFASSDPTIVSINEVTGEMTAYALGTATVRVKTYNGKTATAAVQVLSTPEQLTLSEESIFLGTGEQRELKALLNSGSAGQIAWRSTDESVAVCENGAVTAVGTGSAHIIAETYNGLTAQCTITVTPAPTQIILPEKNITIGVGETLQLQPSVDAGESGFSYRSSRTKYVRVSADGEIRGVSKGTAIVYVRAYNGVEAQCRVTVKAAPKKIEMKDALLELGMGEQYEILWRLSADSAGTVTFASSDPTVAQVDPRTGVITAGAIGNAVITATTYNGRTAQCRVGVYPAPESLSVNIREANLGVGESLSLQAVIPEGTRSQIRYTSRDPAVAEVSEQGVITAVGRGSTVIRVETCVPGVSAEVKIRVHDAPNSVSFGAEDLETYVGDEFMLEPIIPAGSWSSYAFFSSDPAVAAVSADGKVRAMKRGTAAITVRTYNGLTAQTLLHVCHPDYPEVVKLAAEPPVLELGGGEYALEYAVIPATAAQHVEWRSSNTKAAVIDQNGVIYPKGYGFSQITAVSRQDGTVLLEFTLTVQMENLSLTVPARTTSVSGISANLAKIDKIRRSAIRQVDALREGGVISAADASKRRSIINNVFDDYAFAWMTPELQPYWKAANADGGVKDFKPGTVYYGMPYTSGVAKTRQYNFEKALSEGRFEDSGSGYYLLNQDNLLKGQYVGNDCSALVNAAIWGVNDRHVYDRTSRIAVSNVYKTLKSPNSLRPGDLLCRSGRHVVMFLYYANPEKTKIMIIENGGKEWGVNTVHCSVHDISDYLKDGYIGRRLATLD